MKELVGIAEQIAAKLIARKQTIAVAESSTTRTRVGSDNAARAEERTDREGGDEGESSTDDDAGGRADATSATQVRADQTGSRKGEQHDDEGHRHPQLLRRKENREEGNNTSGEKGDGRSEGGMPRTHHVVLVDVELDREVRCQRIVSRQFCCDSQCCLLAQPLRLVETGQFREFLVGGLLQSLERAFVQPSK